MLICIAFFTSLSFRVNLDNKRVEAMFGGGAIAAGARNKEACCYQGCGEAGAYLQAARAQLPPARSGAKPPSGALRWLFFLVCSLKNG